MLNLEQTKDLIVGVLKGWLLNKTTLDKLSETKDGKLLFDGNELTSSSESETEVTQEELQNLITNILIELNQEESEQELKEPPTSEEGEEET